MSPPGRKGTQAAGLGSLISSPDWNACDNVRLNVTAAHEAVVRLESASSLLAHGLLEDDGLVELAEGALRQIDIGLKYLAIAGVIS